MKKQLLLFGLLIILFSACTRKADTTSQAAIDDARIKTYLEANHLSATKGADGIYYSIIVADTSTQHPLSTSTVQVSYKGSLLNGTVFQTQTTGLVPLQNVGGASIVGWQIGLPLMAKGERMFLIVPSALAYGPAGAPDGSVPVPPNSVLVFTIDLLGFY